MQIKIVATYHNGKRAVGIAECEAEAFQAVLCSSARFATHRHVVDLRESVKELFAEASPDVLQADFVHGHWSVVIDWCYSEKGACEKIDQRPP